LDTEVTVIVTTQVVPGGVPVIVKLFNVELLVMEVLKKGAAEEPSIFELTCIFTPLEGIVEVICTASAKSGPRSGVLLLPLAGVVVTTSVASLLPPPLLLWQAGAMAINPAAINKRRFFFISVVKIGL